jgi:hypothetical protein
MRICDWYIILYILPANNVVGLGAAATLVRIARIKHHPINKLAQRIVRNSMNVYRLRETTSAKCQQECFSYHLLEKPLRHTIKYRDTIWRPLSGPIGASTLLLVSQKTMPLNHTSLFLPYDNLHAIYGEILQRARSRLLNICKHTSRKHATKILRSSCLCPKIDSLPYQSYSLARPTTVGRLL